MEPGEWARKALDIIESETRDLVHSGAPTRKSETEVEIAPLVQKIGATSIAEVEKMIGEAKCLLQNSSATIKEISYALCFSETAHFSNFFKKHTSISPIQYRKNLSL